MMRIYIPVILLFVSGCSALKSGIKVQPALANLNAANDMQLAKVQADEISALKANIKNLQSDINAQGAVGAYNTVSKTNTSTSAGRDNINDSELMKEYIATVKDLNERQIKLMQRVIMGETGMLISICCIFAGFITTLIAGLLWLLKFYAKTDAEEDKVRVKIDSAADKVRLKKEARYAR